MIFLGLVYFAQLVLCVFGAGELSILQTPESIHFRGQEQLDLSTVKNVISSVLGFTVPEGPRWSGLVVQDPFGFAEGAVLVAVQGVASLDSVQGRTFPLDTDESLDGTWAALSARLADRFPTADNLTLNYVSADDPARAIELYGTLGSRDSPSLEYLKLTVPEDKAFIDQLNTIDAITSKLADKGVELDGIPDLHWLSVPGLHSLVDIYGANSKQVLEAKRLLSSSVLLLSEVFATAYNDKVLFGVLSSDAVHTRRYRREANDTVTPSSSPSSSDQSSSTYDENYAPMFNIFLWTTVTFIFALLAVSVGIAQMDPGRDSIIYRMTSQRMKKDN